MAAGSKFAQQILHKLGPSTLHIKYQGALDSSTKYLEN